jgi:hypothetical protein
VQRAQLAQQSQIQDIKNNATIRKQNYYDLLAKEESIKQKVADKISPRYQAIYNQSNQATRARLKIHDDYMQRYQKQYQPYHNKIVELIPKLDALIEQCNTLSQPQSTPNTGTMRSIRENFGQCLVEEVTLEPQGLAIILERWHLALHALAAVLDKAESFIALLPVDPAPTQTILCFSIRYRGSLLHDEEEKHASNNRFFVRTHNPALVKYISDLIEANPTTQLLFTVNPAPTRREYIHKDLTRQQLFEQLTTHFKKEYPHCKLWDFPDLAKEAKCDELTDKAWAWRPALRILDRLKELAKTYSDPTTRIVYHIFDSRNAIIQFEDFFRAQTNIDCLPPQITLCLHTYEKHHQTTDAGEGITLYFHAQQVTVCGNGHRSVPTLPQRLFTAHDKALDLETSSFIKTVPATTPTLKRRSGSR